MLKQSKSSNLLWTSFCSLHAEAASSGPWEMLNYINKNVYLPRMVPLKGGCMGVWGVQVFGEFIRVSRRWYGERKASLYGIMLNKWSSMCPHFIVWYVYGGHIKEVKLKPGEVMTSYNVKALFTSVPMDPSINIVKEKLQQDPTLPQRTKISISQIILHSWSFASETLPSSSKVSITNSSMVQPWVPLLALLLPNCLWNSLKSRPLALPHMPHLWLRYMDDTLVIQEAKHGQKLLQHINSQDSNIQFTIEEQNQEGALHFPGTLVSPGPHILTISYTGTATISSQQK